MKVVILCGGSGTRLSPLSRELYPKQFLPFIEKKSLFQETITRNGRLADEYLVVINQEQYFLGLDQFHEAGINKKVNFLLEPTGRNTAPAIALAAFASKTNDILLIVPSDHHIKSIPDYERVLTQAEKMAQDNFLVTIGIDPGHAHTGYGYIQYQENDVLGFKEKPDKTTAEKYIKEGNYLWNGGIFCFKAGQYLHELEKFAPDIYQKSKEAFEKSSKEDVIRIRTEDMKAIRSDSIDYAVLEKSKLIKVVKGDFPWNDLGSFDSIYDVLPKDNNGNTICDHALHVGSKNNLIHSADKLVATIDVENMLIINTSDALLISKRGSGEKVKELLALVKNYNKELSLSHTTVHRPWGTYTILEDSPQYKVKRIVVRPGAKLSLQKHFHRSEHWVVVQGTATVTVNEKTFPLQKNESTYIPKEAHHRLANFENEDLVLIEAQVGHYLGEDDIVRIQDDYKRQ